MSEIEFYNHKVGDGIHYITNNFRILENGDYQEGDTSDGCILVNLETLCVYYGLPMLNDIWNEVYPDDFMSDEDLIYVLLIHNEFTEDYDPSAPDNIVDVLQDAQAMGCAALVERVIELLKEKGISPPL